MSPYLIDLLKVADPSELCALLDFMDESPRPLHYILCWLEEHRVNVLEQYLDSERTDKTPLSLPIKLTEVQREINERYFVDICDPR